ncbi:hypothetical protein QAD02_020486 [Eretmocerus hayati]|uniref:Uncharacterized protein n=1 Tax=Eretmocerus hayati TaxID=131215 RepID=A0ACC2PNK7_9HYME|nr:hypothetical protein QAD02_020486 [Eretmocerus hayati]
MLQRVENAKQIHSEKKARQEAHEASRDPYDGAFPIKGNRIVDLELMQRNMQCPECNEPLLIHDIEGETIRGLSSIFLVRCRKCLLVQTIKSGSEYQNPATGKSLFSCNTKAALGAIHTGIGHSHLEKLFSIMDLPVLSQSVYKQHERMVGPILELVAKESCSEATAMERLLTEESINELKELL